MAMFENFPYTDMHNLNLDWIIKIAKDFLDQYTHIQQLIEDGEESLNTIISDGTETLQQEVRNGIQSLEYTASQLTNALNAWYAEHSEDISDELADAIQSLNNELTVIFGKMVQKAEETIESIPADYTELSNTVLEIIEDITRAETELYNLSSNVVVHPLIFDYGFVIRSDGTIWDDLADYATSKMYPCEANKTLVCVSYAGREEGLWLSFYDSSETFISGIDGIRTPNIFTTPANTAFVRIGYNVRSLYKVYIIERANEHGVINTQNLIIPAIQEEKESVAFLIKNALGQENIAAYSQYKENTYRNVEGIDISANGWRRSDLIPVTGDTTYYTPTKTFVCFYNSSYQFISAPSTPTYQFTTPASCAYVVISYDEPHTPNGFYLVNAPIESDRRKVFVGSTEYFKKIRDAVDFANTIKDITIYVKEGTYDIISEFGGQGLTNTGGMNIGNGTTIIFSEGAEVVCEYTGGNEFIEQNFSIFNASHSGVYDDFAIIGMKCRAKNIRYCIHDEMASQTIPYTHIFKDCSMYIDNTHNTHWSSKQCIGGGLGTRGRIEVVNCYFESEGVTSEAVVSWHNHYQAGSKSRLYLTGNVLGNGRIEFYNYGQQTEKTIAFVSNNMCAYSPRVNGYEGYPNMIELRAWSNVILYN